MYRLIIVFCRNFWLNGSGDWWKYFKIRLSEQKIHKYGKMMKKSAYKQKYNFFDFSQILHLFQVQFISLEA